MTPARAKELSQNLIGGDRRALARLITMAENQEENTDLALANVYFQTGRAQILGITGPPGAGKSTLTDKLITEARAKRRKVGVVCVDPSSPFSGGAILGDRIRMQEHASDGDVFIRSIGTRGGQGGISRSTQEVVMLLDAAGFDLIILETAGVGQTELGVLEVAQSIIVVLVPESGDDIQMMKAGILEIADILVVNKCDRQGSDHVVKELRAMLELSSGTSSWTIPVVKTIAERGEGVREVHERADEHWKFLKKSGALKSRNRRFARTAVINIIRDLVASAASTSMNHPQGLALVDAVAERELDPFTAAQKFLSGKF